VSLTSSLVTQATASSYRRSVTPRPTVKMALMKRHAVSRSSTGIKRRCDPSVRPSVCLSVCLFRFLIIFRWLYGDMRTSPFQTHLIGGSAVGDARIQMLSVGSRHFAARYLLHTTAVYSRCCGRFISCVSVCLFACLSLL